MFNFVHKLAISTDYKTHLITDVNIPVVVNCYGSTAGAHLRTGVTKTNS